MESSERQSERPVPMGWHRALLRGGRTCSRYRGWGNKLWTRAGNGKLSHPERGGKCCKADLEPGKI